MVWSVVHLVITPGHFEAFIMPLRPHKASDQYPRLKIFPLRIDTNRLVMALMPFNG
jgi:hypothetical protein